MKRTKDGIPIVNYAPDWSFWSKIPVVGAHEAILLTLDIDPRGYQRFPNSKIEERYKELDKIAASHIANGSLVILNRIAGSVSIADWWTWAESIGIEIPSQAKSFNVARTEGSIAILGGKNTDPAEAPKATAMDEAAKPDIESEIADDIYNRVSRDSNISEIGGGVTIFDYLTKTEDLKLNDGTPYFLRVEDSHEDQRKNVADRKYGGVTLCASVDGKLQKLKIRKLVDAFALRKKQEILQ